MKTEKYLTLALLFSFLFVGCKKEDNRSTDPLLPTLTTTTINASVPDFAEGGGIISADGGSPITGRGVCWGISAGADLSGNHTSDGTGTGSFTSRLSVLRAATTYYARAYAINDAGTAYGNEISFTTPPNIFVSGYKFLGSNPAATIWKNGVPTYLTNANSFACAEAVTVSGGDVYAVGYENGSNMIAKMWKNGNPTVLSNTNSQASAQSIAVSGSDVYIAGYEYLAGVARAKLWKNGVPTTLSNPANEGNAKSVFVAGSDIYAAGYESVGLVPEAKVWKNGVGTSLTGGVLSYANSVYVSGTDVYVAGVSNGRAMLWKNGVAFTLTPSDSGSASKVLVSGSDVYVIGYEHGQFHKMATVWKNNVATRLDTGSHDSFAYGIFVLGNDVYVAGYNFFSSNGYAMLWKNGMPIQLSDGSVDAGAVGVFVTTE